MNQKKLSLPYIETSATLFNQLVDSTLPIFLDSCSELINDFSGKDLITANPEFIFIARSDSYQLLSNDLKQIESGKNALEKIIALEKEFDGNIFGYFSYHAKDVDFKINAYPNEKNQIPDLCLGFYPWRIECDHTTKTCTLFFLDRFENKLDSLLNLLTLNKNDIENKQSIVPPLSYKSNFSYSDYESAFNKVKKHILDGNCYQVNLAQRFEAYFEHSAWPYYLQCRVQSPAPFCAFLSTPFGDILSFSPESFLEIDSNGNMSSQPIKGTRSRSEDVQQDNNLKIELKNSEKDKAENLMIVDLIRNDLSKNAQLNSVKVAHLFNIESFSNVHHMVSKVNARKKESITPFEVLLDCFPGGSITGAPKQSAMEIIRALEPNARQIYCGAIGYKSAEGNLQFNIAIRTMLISNKTLLCWGGGGLVADSVCESEYQETLNKVNNLIAVDSFK